MPTLRRTSLTALLSSALVLSAFPAGAADGELVIGYAAAVTGNLSMVDSPDGVRCRVEQINEAGGINGAQIRLEIRDTKSDAVTAANVAQDLIDSGADVLFGPPTDDGLIPMASLALPQGIAVLSVGSTQAAFPQAAPENGYLVPFGDNASAAAAAEFAYAAGHRKVVLMIAHDVGAYSLLTPEYFAQAFEKLGGEVVGRVTYHHGLADYTAQVTEISNLPGQPDMIFAAILNPDAGVLARTLKTANVNLPVYGTDGFDDPSFIDVAGPGAELATFATHGFADDGSALKAFFDDCEKRGYTIQNVFFGLGGEAVEIVKTAAEAARSFDPVALNAAIREIEGMQGIVANSVTYKGQGGTPLKEITIIQVKDGAFAPVARLTPGWVAAP